MNTPLLLTSVALLAGVAARPIENDHRGDDLHKLAHSPEQDDRQAFLGQIPSSFQSLNSLHLHDLHDHTHSDDSAPNGSTSPKLTGVDSPSDPDPGLSSPYMGPQRHISSVEEELRSPALTPHSPTPSSPAPRNPGQTRLGEVEDPGLSPMVVVLVFSSLAALVLLGLTVAIVYASQVLRMLQEDVWRSIAGGRGGEKGAVNWCQKEKERQQEKQTILEAGMDQGVITAREVPSERSSTSTTNPIKSSENSVEDPEVPSLPDVSSTSSVPTVYTRKNNDRNVGLALAPWTYDNWVTHFMMALFGWLGIFFGGTRAR